VLLTQYYADKIEKNDMAGHIARMRDDGNAHRISMGKTKVKACMEMWEGTGRRTAL